MLVFGLSKLTLETGKEGKKKNWQPWDCMKIIMDSVGPGENHGCPFRHNEGKTVRERLLEYDLPKVDVDAIMKKVEEGHYQIACGMHFSLVHSRDLTTGPTNHPNQWYIESRNIQTGAGESQTQKRVHTHKAVVYGEKDNKVKAVLKPVDDTDLMDDTDDADLLAAMESGIAD